MSLQLAQKTDGRAVTVTLCGRLDTVTSPELETLLDGLLAETGELTLDCEGLEYVSSAGLRVFLKAQKAMNTHGTMKLTHVSEAVLEVLDLTGFSDFLTIV